MVASGAARAAKKSQGRLFALDAQAESDFSSPAEWTIISGAQEHDAFPACEHPAFRRKDGRILRIHGPNRQLLLDQKRQGPVFAFEGSSPKPLSISALAYWPLGNDRYRFLLRDGGVVESESPLGEVAQIQHTLPALERAVMGQTAILAMGDNRLFRSTDGMDHWQEIRLPIPSREPFKVQEFRMNPKGEGLIRYSPERVLVTHDDGKTFVLAQPRPGAGTAEGLLQRWVLAKNFGECTAPLGSRSSATRVDSVLLDDGWAGIFSNKASDFSIVVAHGQRPPKITPWAPKACRYPSVRAFQDTLGVLCDHADGVRLYFSNDDGEHFEQDPDTTLEHIPYQWEIGPNRSLIVTEWKQLSVRSPMMPDPQAAPRWTKLPPRVEAARFNGNPVRIWTVSNGEHGLVVESSDLHRIGLEYLGTLDTTETVERGTFFNLHSRGLDIFLGYRELHRFDASGHLQRKLDLGYISSGAQFTGNRLLKYSGASLQEWNPQSVAFSTSSRYPEVGLRNVRCNASGCLFDSAYRRGWDLSRASNGQPDSPPIREKSISCRAATTSGALSLLRWDDMESSEFSGLCVEVDGQVEHFSLSLTGVVTKTQLLGPGPALEANLRVLQDRTVLRIRSATAQTSEVEWARWNPATGTAVSNRSLLPLSADELTELQSVLIYQGWSVFDLRDRQLVVPPKAKPYFLRDLDGNGRFLFSGPGGGVWELLEGGYEQWITFTPLSGGSTIGWNFLHTHVTASLENEGIVINESRRVPRLRFPNEIERAPYSYRWVIDPRNIPLTIPDPTYTPTSRGPAVDSAREQAVFHVAWDQASIELSGSPTAIPLDSDEKVIWVSTIDGYLAIPLASPETSLVVYQEAGMELTTPIRWSAVKCEIAQTN